MDLSSTGHQVNSSTTAAQQPREDHRNKGLLRWTMVLEGSTTYVSMYLSMYVCMCLCIYIYICVYIYIGRYIYYVEDQMWYHRSRSHIVLPIASILHWSACVFGVYIISIYFIMFIGKEKAAWGCSTSLSGSIIIQLHHRNLQFHESTVGRTWVVHRTCEISSSFIACNFRYTWRIWINLTNVPILDPIGSYWILWYQR